MIEMANDTECGLSAAIFTENLLAAFRLADRLYSGAIHINSMTVHDEFSLPHGGVKKSGLGRFQWLPRHGGVLVLKVYHLDAVSHLDMNLK